MKKILLFLLCSIFAFTSCNNTKDDKTITIACNLPMTGYIGVYGEWIKNGIDFYMEHNKEMIDSLGLKYRIDYQDNKGEVKDAINIAKRQLLNSPDFYMSGLTSQTMAVLDLVEQKKNMHFLWAFTPLTLVEGTNQFRTWVNYGMEAKHYVEYCKANNPQKIALLFINLIGAKSQCEEVIIPELKKINPTIEFLVEEFPVGHNDFKSSALKIKKFNPDIILTSGFKDNIMNILKDFETYNIDRSKVMCSMDLLDAAIELPISTVEGVKVVSPAFNISSMQTENQVKWSRAFEKRYNKTPMYTEAYAYDMMNAITNAIKLSLQNSIPVESAIFQVNIPGITGNINFERNGELVGNTYICTYRKGKLEVVPLSL